jgi:hypothetical protein
MVLGFKSPNNSLVKSPKALNIGNATALTEKMESIFGDIKDPRVKRKPVHLLTDILIIAKLATKAFETLNLPRNVKILDTYLSKL